MISIAGAGIKGERHERLAMIMLWASPNKAFDRRPRSQRLIGAPMPLAASVNAGVRRPL